MEAWRKTWRDGVAPLLSMKSLQALKRGLETDDICLIQGATTSPPPMQCVQVEYKIVPGFPAYMAGTDGSLWTKHIRGAKGKRLSESWQVAGGQKEKSGYIRDSLHRPGEFRRVRRHQVILETFVGGCPKGMEACHENDVKTDNRLCNLSWGTRSKNAKDAHRNGIMPTMDGRPNAKLNFDIAQSIRSERKSGSTLRQLSKRYSVSIGTIRQVLSFRTYAPEIVSDSPFVEAACALGYCGWKGEGLETVGEVEEFFARMCFEIDQRLDEPAGCRWFLNPFDENPRGEFFPELLAEVNLSISGRVEAG